MLRHCTLRTGLKGASVRGLERRPFQHFVKHSAAKFHHVSAIVRVPFIRHRLQQRQNQQMALHVQEVGQGAVQQQQQQDSSLWATIVAAYDRAQVSGAAFSIETQGELLRDPLTGAEFILRVSTALQHKPAGEKPSGPKPPSPNPFLPYEPRLWVCHLSATHTLLLNKFNVVPHHLLVVTRDLIPQEDGLDAGDLEASWQVLQGMQPGGLAFFNCGPESGASQPHKHVQVVPLPFHPTQPLSPPIQPLVDSAAGGRAPLEPFAVQGMPCQAFACTLPPGLSTAELHTASQALHGRCQEVLQQQGGTSYNVLLTLDMMMYIPRRRGGAGPCSLNALAFAGTMLLRFEEELQYVRATGPGTMLAAAGYPW